MKTLIIALIVTLSFPLTAAAQAPPSPPSTPGPPAPPSKVASPLPAPPTVYGPPATRPPPPDSGDELPRVLNNYEVGDPIPPGYVERGRVRKGLIVGGAVTLGTTWLLSSLVGAIGSAAGPDEWGFFAVPVAGPFICMGALDNNTAEYVLFAVNGVLQTGGLAMMLAGIFAEEKYLVRAEWGQTEVEIAPAPLVSQSVQGVGLVGRF